MKPRALVVDDEAQMVSIVTFALETQDFHVRKCHHSRKRLGTSPT